MTSFDLDLTKYSLGWSDEVEYAFAPEKGLNPGVVDQISWWKGEPRWMTNMRLRALKLFERKPMAPWFAVNMPDIDFQDIYYYLRPSGEQVDEWDQLPEQMKATYEKLGIPEAERQYLAGVTAQYESEVVYHRNREELEQQGILFSDMDTALREYPDLVKKYFGTVIPPGDNKFAALNTSVWSGGSFIYVPPGVNVEMPLQAYFRINSENAGQFERTLIIADEGAQVHYIEGCSAPVYTSNSLHSAVVEIIVKPSARVTYTTIQNWSPNVYNLVTKRARVEAEGHMEWIDGNIGCLAQGSTVTTRGGVKPIELVSPGDEVLSFDHDAGELCWRRVLGKRDSGEQPVREVRVGARTLRVTDNHPFLSFTHDPSRPKKLGRYELAYVRADQLSQAIVPATSLDYGEPYKLDRPTNVTDFVGANQYQVGYEAQRARSTRLVAAGDDRRRRHVAVRPLRRRRLDRDRAGGQRWSTLGAGHVLGAGYRSARAHGSTPSSTGWPRTWLARSGAKAGRSPCAAWSWPRCWSATGSAATRSPSACRAGCGACPSRSATRSSPATSTPTVRRPAAVAGSRSSRSTATYCSTWPTCSRRSA